MQYFTIPQAAKIIHKSKNTVYAWVNEGRITYYDNGYKLIREDDLDRYMKQHYLRHGERKRLVELPDSKEV